MFVNLLFLVIQEPLNFLNSCIFFKGGAIFESFILISVGVVPHEELSQEDARVEPLLDTIINFAILRVDEPVDLSGELLETGYEHWIDLLCQVDVEMLAAPWQVNRVGLGPQQGLDQANGLIGIGLHVVAGILLVDVLILDTGE
jgi:hypothetical protein